MSAWTRWLNLFRRARLERDLEDEVRFHLESRAADLAEGGLERNEAEVEAVRRFGNPARIRREMQEVRMVSRRTAGIAGVSIVALVVAGAVGWVARGSVQSPAFYRIGDRGLELPSPIHRQDPQYTTEAMQAKIQGTVMLECVVKPTGLCEDIQIARSLDPGGLDQQAIKAAQAWRFAPGKRGGEPVPVLVNIEMAFRLR